jgi:hypothetical protein
MLLRPMTRQAAPAGRQDPVTPADSEGIVGAAVAVHARVRQGPVLVPGEPTAWMVIPVLAGLAVLLVLGLHPPGELTGLITRAAAQLGGAS